MKKVFFTTAALALLAAVISPAQAAITIESATEQNGAAYITGHGAALSAQITWQGSAVTTANKKNGGFSFYGVLPPSCTGTLSDTTPADTVQVTVVYCTPSTSAPVAKTGQTTIYDQNSPPRDDGALQKGVASPVPRFTDNGNGTITDKLTGLIWLKNAECAGGAFPGEGENSWQGALNYVVSLNATGTMNGSFSCGDTSNLGSHQTDWRLPNVRELQSLVDYGTYNPALPPLNSFTNFQAFYYWSSTSYASNPTILAWSVGFFDGGVGVFVDKSTAVYVIAVRGGS